jgi:polyphosphate kinase 2 (PPK2 family)
MAKNKLREAVAGQDYQLMENGVVVVKRQFDNLLEPYKEEEIPDILGAVNHKLRIDRKKAYEKSLRRYELEFNALVRLLEHANLRCIFAFQGWNGGGKSGAITRLVEATGHDPKILKWIPIGPPNDEDKKHDYLWRFSKYDRMPAVGQVSAFDRSWFERLMIEKVACLAPDGDIKKSYEEIRSWEQGLTSRGYIVINVWMDITQKEQWRRFKERKRSNPWKLTEADLEERKHVEEYRLAINEMIWRTGTQYTQWNVISSEDKKYSRVTVLDLANQQMIERLVAEVGRPQLVKMVVELLGQIMPAKKLLKVMRRLLKRIMTPDEVEAHLTQKKLNKVLGEKLLKKILNGQKLNTILKEIKDEQRKKQEKKEREKQATCAHSTPPAEPAPTQPAETDSASELRTAVSEQLLADIAAGKKPRKALSRLKKLIKKAAKAKTKEAKVAKKEAKKARKEAKKAAEQTGENAAAQDPKPKSPAPTEPHWPVQ